MFEDRKFKQREIKKILRVAIDRKYSSQNQPSGIGFSELSEIAKDGDVTPEDLNEAIKEYDGKKKRIRGRLVGLAVIAALGTGATFGIRSITNHNKLVNEPVNVSVTDTRRGPDKIEDIGYMGCPGYIIQFTDVNGNNYTANVHCNANLAEYYSKREIIKKGSEILTTRGVLEDFTQVAPHTFSGTIGYNDITIVKP